MNGKATDWDAYYGSVPAYTSFTRSISSRKLIARIKAAFADASAIRICEIGGANSCFVEDIASHISVADYHVVDLNARGLALLKDRRPQCALTWEQSDVLTPHAGAGTFDLVYSVGLIEHFDAAGTANAIEGHFARCRPGGLVLVTFPTPTLLYRTIRSVAEHMGIWKFPDERPLGFDEVIGSCQALGRVEHRSVNWWIGLTQGYVAVRKSTEAREGLEPAALKDR